MTPRVNLITLGVSDIVASRAFYERLGFKASSAGNDNVAFFDANGVVLALIAGTGPEFLRLAFNHRAHRVFLQLLWVQVARL